MFGKDVSAVGTIKGNSFSSTGGSFFSCLLVCVLLLTLPCNFRRVSGLFSGIGVT